MNIQELIEDLEKIYPRDLSYDFDNPGLNVGKSHRTIKGVMVTLDIDSECINKAKESGCNLIISHHPLIFYPIKNINDDKTIERHIMSLIENDISAYSMHTNFDVKKKVGMADIVKDVLFTKKEIKTEYPLEKVDAVNGLGSVIEFKDPLSINEIEEKLKKNLDIKTSRLRIYTKKNVEEENIKKLVILPGSGKSDIDKVIQEEADLYLSGDLSHNHIFELLDYNISYIDCTHFGLEKIFVDYMYDYLKKEYNEFKIYKYNNTYM